eukprot:13288118-Heterocapsa_arctica.AAC.1
MKDLKGNAIGYQEACRIVAHLTKDSSEARKITNTNAYLFKSAQEAIGGVTEPRMWLADAKHLMALQRDGKGNDKGIGKGKRENKGKGDYNPTSQGGWGSYSRSSSYSRGGALSSSEWRQGYR